MGPVVQGESESILFAGEHLGKGRKRGVSSVSVIVPELYGGEDRGN